MRHLPLLGVALAACTPSGSQGPVDSGTGTASSSGAASSASPSSDGVGADAGPGLFRVMTYNVERLFDATCDTGTCGRGEFEPAPTAAQVNARVVQIANAIRPHAPDVLCVQEVETPPLLQQLAVTLDGGYRTAVLAETGGAASVDVGLLARGRQLEVRRHRMQRLTRADGGSTTFAREFLEVHVQEGDLRIIAFCAHFRSKVNDDPERRFLEAGRARAIVLERVNEFPDAFVVLAGDLNDTPGSDALLALEGDGGLLRVSSALASPEDATTFFNGQPEAIDHLYVPDGNAGRLVPESVRVERDVPGSRGGLGGSDHAALRADFRR